MIAAGRGRRRHRVPTSPRRTARCPARHRKVTGQVDRRRVDKHAKLLVTAGDLGREPVHQEPRCSAELSNTRPAPSGRKGSLSAELVRTAMAQVPSSHGMPGVRSHWAGLQPAQGARRHEFGFDIFVPLILFSYLLGRAVGSAQVPDIRQSWCWELVYGPAVGGDARAGSTPVVRLPVDARRLFSTRRNSGRRGVHLGVVRARRCARSPWWPRRLRISTGWSSALPNQWGVRVSNSAASPGPMMRSLSPRTRRRRPSRT